MRIARGSGGPRTVSIETTSACNLKCVHCTVSLPGYKGKTLSWESFGRVLPFLERHRPLVHLSGHGEPLICGRFVQMFEAVVAAGCRVSFQSNGMLLSPELTCRLLDAGAADGFVQVCFSLDAAEQGLFEHIRRGASFETYCRNVSFLAEEKRRRGVTSPRITFEFVAMKMNAEQLPAAVRLAAQLGGEEFIVSDLVECEGLEAQGLAHDVDSARPYFREAREAARSVGVRFWAMPAFDRLTRDAASDGATARAAAGAGDRDERPDQSAPRTGPELPAMTAPPAPPPGIPPAPPSRGLVKDCHDPWRTTFVQANGDVIPCCFMELPMGNVAEQPLHAIWRGPRYRALRRLVASTEPPAQCRRCILRGWKHASASTRLKEAARRALEHAGSIVFRPFAGRRSRLTLRIGSDRPAYRPGERCLGHLSVEVGFGGATRQADLYVVVQLPTGERYFATDRGLEVGQRPLFAAWRPQSISLMEVLSHSVPPLAGKLDVELRAIAVPAGSDPTDESQWLASHATVVAVQN